MKRFEVEVEVIQVREVHVWADNFAEAIDRAKSMKIDEVLREGYTNDHEMRVIGARRNIESRMYR